jgi:hypothetical protein
MTADDLKIGHTYFGIAYEDEHLLRPLIHSYEYRGTQRTAASDTDGQMRYVFRFMGSDDVLELEATQLDLILSLPDLIEALKARL